MEGAGLHDGREIASVACDLAPRPSAAAEIDIE
jgi:hypothetical protein